MVKPGTMFLGKYRIERILGEGGMGVVAHAHHVELDRPVAIKFLRPAKPKSETDSKTVSETVVDRFRREAQAAVKLNSEHVCRVYDVSILNTGSPYMVMEYLEGRDLSEVLRERTRLELGFAVDLMLQACEALGEAHGIGIVHRDIKPANCFLTEGLGSVPLLKVLDFGISKSLLADHTMTHSQTALGTPSYMSPEQFESSKNVDARTDIWSLGVMLYQLVSGRRPFQAPSIAGICYLVMNQPPPPLDDVYLPNGFEAVIGRCLAKDPAARIANTAVLAAALAPYAATPNQAERSVECTKRLLERHPSASMSISVPSSQNTPAGGIVETPAPVTTMAESRGQRVPSEATYLQPQLVAEDSGSPAKPAVPSPATEGETGGSRRGGTVKALIALGAAAVVGAVLFFGFPRARNEAPTAPAAATLGTDTRPPARGLARPVAADSGAAESLDAGVAQQQDRPMATEPRDGEAVDQGAIAGELDGPAKTNSANGDAQAERPAERRTRRSERRRGNKSSKRRAQSKRSSEKRSDAPSEDDDLFGTRN